MGENKEKIIGDQKELKGLFHIYQKTLLMISETFGKIFCELMRQKVNFLEGLSPVTCGIKLTQHFRKKLIIQQSNMVVVV